MENRMTVKEALEIVVQGLEGIQIPVALMEQIGFPIKQQMDNLRECIRAIDMAEQPKETEDIPDKDAPAVTEDEI